jgi:hypothetical protein
VLHWGHGGVWAMPGCLVGYMDIKERSRAMLGYPVCYMGVMERSRTMLGYTVR